MPPLSQSLRFFHTDHLGSASWITGYTGSALQHLQYLPFGEPWVSQTSNSYEGAKYTFSGKERDKETGLMYFGARYYNPEYGIWNQVDPLHGKYPYQSPFVYCANNPLRVIDPWGLDEWELNKKGQIIKYTKTKEHDKFIINGKEKTFEYGTVTHQARKTLSGKDYDSYKLKGDAKSTELFEFVASNTDVEWSHAKLGIAGNKGLNYLTTSHEEEFENGMSELLYNQLRFGYSLREINHSHPGNVDYPSGSFDYKGKKTGEWGDVGFAKWNNAIFGSKVKFNIFTPKDGKYIPYSAKSKLKDYSGYGKSYHSEFIEFDSKNMLFLQKQYIKPTPFYLKEYKIKDSVFYKSLCNIIFSEISNVEKMMNGDFLSLFIFDSLREFCAIDDSLYKIKIKKSNCTIFSEPKLYKDDITRLNGYFILNNKTFLFYIANKSILHSLFQPVNSSKKFYHYGKMQPWYKLGYSAWHMILKEDNSLQYVGYEIAE
jgi:RHS repeat-associated protein